MLHAQRRAAGAAVTRAALSASERTMQINGTLIDDTFAEAFPMKATRLVITAHTPAWARAAAQSLSGFATSVIDCGCEAGIEREVDAADTPDGRPGIAVLMFAVSSKELAKQMMRRVGQCVLTCPTTAVYSGIDPKTSRAPLSDVAPLGGALRFFGDGWQIAKMLGDTRYWRVPVMDGEFVCEESTVTVKAVGGGNLLLLARDTDHALAAAEAAVAAMHQLPNVITPLRRRALGVEDRLEVSGRRGIDQLSVLPVADRRREAHRADCGSGLRARDRDRRADRRRRRCRNDGRHRGRVERGRCAAHLGGQLRRQARPVSLSFARAGGGDWRCSARHRRERAMSTTTLRALRRVFYTSQWW
jgi:formylmethanofuran:tetrahydromethanopterin formyltransferase